MTGALKKELDMDFDQAIEHVKEILPKQGFPVLLAKNIDEVFKKQFKLDHYERYTFILACNPNLAKMALDISKEIGFMFPCSFVVYEDQGKVFVAHASIMKAAKLMGLGPAKEMEPLLEATSKEIHKAWEKI